MPMISGAPGAAPFFDDIASGLRLPVVHARRVPVLVMEAGIGPVSPGGPDAGWVSGNLANLGPSATVQAVFDLGPDWDQYGLCQLNVLNPTSPHAGLGVQPGGSDTTAYSGSRRLSHAFSAQSDITYKIVGAAKSEALTMRPVGRYLVVILGNADAAVPISAAARVVLTAYPT